MSIPRVRPASMLAAAAVVLTLGACGSSSQSAVTVSSTSTAPGSATAAPTSPPAATASSGGGSTTASGTTSAPGAEGGPTAALTDPCAAVQFGAALAPLNPPSDPHVYSAAPPMTIDVSRLYEATITTGRGRIVLCLQPQLAPATVNNFVTLARNHFFDGLTFHRVVANFVVQGGDPKGDGSGGPGYQFADEPVKARYGTGAVAMANAGPDTNGSQFFICIADGAQCASLPPQYSLFGVVHSGQDVANATVQGDVTTTVTVSVQS